MYRVDGEEQKKKKRKREKGGSKGRRTSRMLGRMGGTQESLGSVGDTSLIRVKTHKYCSGQVTLGSGDKKSHDVTHHWNTEAG